MPYFYDVTLENEVRPGADILRRACAVQIMSHAYAGSVLSWPKPNIVRMETMDRQLELAIQAGITKGSKLRINVNGAYQDFGLITTITRSSRQD
jgi:hypothetical protein